MPIKTDSSTGISFSGIEAFDFQIAKGTSRKKIFIGTWILNVSLSSIYVPILFAAISCYFIPYMLFTVCPCTFTFVKLP
jgi:hypothetical protein